MFNLCSSTWPKSQLRADWAYLASSAASIFQAGPLLDGDGRMIGSLIIVDADDIDDVRRFHDDDPFTRAGLFETVLLSRWDKHIG